MAILLSSECFTEKLIENVKSTFKRLETTLKARETQLLRQIDVILQQYNITQNISNSNKSFNQINIVFNNEIEILKLISNFGVVDFEGITFENNLIYQLEDYENPSCDHVCLHKCLNNKNFKHFKAPPDVVPNNILDNLNDLEGDQIKEKVKTSTIVKNLQYYASTLKPVQSFEDFHNMEGNTILNDGEAGDDSGDSFHDATSEFPESEHLFEEKDVKNFYSSRHEGRLARVSLANLAEQIEERCKNLIVKDDVLETTEESNVSETQIKESGSINAVQSQNMNIEYPIQQWMQQISREPESEPIQNNELMEHVNITSV